jgi:hypothetical protein
MRPFLANRMKLLVILSVALVMAPLQGCFMHKGYTGSRTSFYSSRLDVIRGIHDDDSSYSQGFRSGCNTSTGIVGEGFNRFKGFEYDAERAISDSEYSDGFTRGFNYCTFYADTDPL